MFHFYIKLIQLSIFQTIIFITILKKKVRTSCQAKHNMNYPSFPIPNYLCVSLTFLWNHLFMFNIPLGFPGGH